MSDIFGETSDTKTIKRGACRVAYTINNVQPVVCTIIGDQPLFYMDFESNYEDEMDLSFDAAESGILESEIKALKKEIETIDKFSADFAKDTETKIVDFLMDMDFMTAPQEERLEDNIEDLTTALCDSRVAQAYMACAEEHNVIMRYSTQVQTSHYDRVSAQILINPNIEFPAQILLAAQELRRHWQHRQGALINPLMFHPDNAVLINRAQEADLVTSIVRVAWELQLSGQKDAWEYLENSSMADLGRAFAREAFLDFRTINNGQAAASVFEAWFLSERCRAQDKILINQMLADYKGYVFDLEEAEQNITPTLIAALGEMPFGKNYLAEHAITIMDDAIFTDVRDRSNANFLWFIKFERSFRETEQELQTSSDHHSEGSSSFVSQGQTKGQNHGCTQAPAGEIVQLFEGQDIAAKTGDKPEKSGKRLAPIERPARKTSESDNSNVVYLRRWSGE